MTKKHSISVPVGSAAPCLSQGSQATLSNTLLTGGYDLTETEILVILLALSSVNSSPEDDQTVLLERRTRFYYFSTKEYARAKSLDPDSIYKTFKAAIKSLKERLVYIHMPDGSTYTCNWVSEIHDKGNNDVFGLRFSLSIQDYILDLRSNFTRINLPSFVTVDGKYAKRLYMLFEQRRFRGVTGTAEWAVKDLQQMWGVPEKSREFKVFYRTIFQAAIRGLSKVGYLQDVKVAKARYAGGREVSHLRVSYTLTLNPEQYARKYHWPTGG